MAPVSVLTALDFLVRSPRAHALAGVAGGPRCVPHLTRTRVLFKGAPSGSKQRLELASELHTLQLLAAANALSADDDVGHCASSRELLENLLHLAVALLSALVQLDQGVAHCARGVR